MDYSVCENTLNPTDDDVVGAEDVTPDTWHLTLRVYFPLVPLPIPK